MKFSYKLLTLSALMCASASVYSATSKDLQELSDLLNKYAKSGLEADRQAAHTKYQAILSDASNPRRRQQGILNSLQERLKRANLTEAQLRTAVTRAPGAGTGAAPVIAGPAAAVPTITDANVRAGIARFTAALDKLRADAAATLLSGDIRNGLDTVENESLTLYNQLTVEQRAAFAAEIKALNDRWNEIEAMHDIQRDIIEDIAYLLTVAREADTVIGAENARKLIEDRIGALPAVIRTRINARKDIADLRTALQKHIVDLQKQAADAKKKADDEVKAAADAVAKAKEADERKKAEDALAALRKEQEEKAKAERDAKAEAERIAREDAAKQRAHDEKVAREAKEEKERADREAAEQAQRDKAEAERKAKEAKAGALDDAAWTRLKTLADKLDAGQATGAEKAEFPALLARAQANRAAASKAQIEILEAATESAGLL